VSGAVLRVISPGAGATLQDLGRPGWRRFGVPGGGAMDPPAARWANRLAGNPDSFPVLELAWQGAELLVLRDGWFAIAGAGAGCLLSSWSASELRAGTHLSFPRSESGIWTYVAVAGGWEAERWLGSASAYPRGKLGRLLRAGDELSASVHSPTGIARRTLRADERPDYLLAAPFPLLLAPQTSLFSKRARASLVETVWKISADCDRTGYRLQGPSLPDATPGITSEPVLPGSLQVPGNGCPIVTMPDGPTVGGYAKIALLPPEALWRLAQQPPGSEIRFCWEERIVLNCDLGEGEAPALTEALMKGIGAANIACGGHAGDAGSIRRCLDLCGKYDVLPGAHPGQPGAFGRDDMKALTPRSFGALLEKQLGLFEKVLAEKGLELHHVKLHGSLYHAVEEDEALGGVYVKGLKNRSRPPMVFSRAGGSFAKRARGAGLEVWEEAFADRGYAPDGTLLPRHHPEGIISNPARIVERANLLSREQMIVAHDGSRIPCRGRTLCLHGDTPGVMKILRALRSAEPSHI